ncbi:MAG TPA: hypothetical protein VJA23_02485 [Candidatus Nanoarchaeia archaeon]|nr:hypothetical protein [Candidatus Nanoarchaeia archaeon]
MEKDYQYDLTPEQIKGREVVFTTGLGQANIHDPNQPRYFDHVLNKLFPGLRTAGMMNYGEGSRWDDRKYRLNPPFIHPSNEHIVVPMGLTYFGASIADIHRSDEVNQTLKTMGREIHDDSWAFFSRAIGVAFVPVTKDGQVFVGKRIGSLYPGYLNAVAGGVDYAGQPSLYHFKEQAIQELKEEYGQRLELVEAPRFVGIASHPLKGDADVVWVGRIDAPAEYFTSGRWREERKDVEHAPELVRIAHPTERDKLLNRGWFNHKDFTTVRVHFPGIMYSTRLGLESLTEDDFRKE